jgi:hypothetical protein
VYSRVIGAQHCQSLRGKAPLGEGADISDCMARGGLGKWINLNVYQGIAARHDRFILMITHFAVTMNLVS